VRGGLRGIGIGAEVVSVGASISLALFFVWEINFGGLSSDDLWVILPLIMGSLVMGLMFLFLCSSKMFSLLPPWLKPWVGYF